ncbi:zinc ribbon domain-containing protein [Rhodococcus pyridinivorans]|uniref:zinc ribbon domain-containing protein n=1 Tax=Rhodococcus pyridinivorans TaxID=103816 RepID=UPI002079031F|nr:zinc ribbon domain-containing protein [Rhodococcus pyridinivorans]USI91480.1 zinc ribbon domain-containing protein [Rhodococcus pyridinivorans]UTM38385.1 zinc ribbon domain-containing protein [Rhodococcus pyridinivorans]
MSIIVQSCRNCGEHYFPYRLVCPACGKANFADVEIDSGTVEDVVRTAADVAIGTVRCGPRLCVIARLTPTDLRPGAVVALNHTITDGADPAGFVPARTPGVQRKETYIQ